MSRKGGRQRTSTAVENDRVQIAKLYLNGNTQDQIGKITDLHQTQVSKELAAIREQWKVSALIDFNERQGAELERIDLLEYEYIEGFKRSQSKKLITTVKKVPMIEKDGSWQMVNESEIVKRSQKITHVIVEETIKTEERDGDAKWLDGIAKCINMRLRLFGLYNIKPIYNSEQNREVDELLVSQKYEILMTLVEDAKNIEAGGKSIFE